MANRPIQSIKYPGLSDTYTFTQVDPTLTQPGQAADAKETGTIKEDFSAYVGTDNVLAKKNSEFIADANKTYARKDIFEYTGTIVEGEWYGFSFDSITGATNSSPARIKLMNNDTEIRNTSNPQTARIQITAEDIANGVNKIVAFIYASTTTPTSAECVVYKPVLFRGLNEEFTYSNNLDAYITNQAHLATGEQLFGGTINNTETYESCDELPHGKTYVITNAGNLTNKPESEGIITTISHSVVDYGIATQLFWGKTGTTYIRVQWTNWTSWKKVLFESNDDALSSIITVPFSASINEFVNTTTGKFVSAGNYQRTDYTPIKATKILVGVGTTATNVGIAFYDNARKFISGTDFNQYTIGDKVLVNVPPYTKYFVYCGLVANSTSMSIDNIYIASAVNLTNENPCFYTDSNECRTFKKILCIGDSLTSGQFDYKEDGVTKEFNDPDYAYPAYLKAITGRDTTNAGDAGETTVSWYALHGAEDFSGHDACIIHLGRNDYAGSNAVSSADRIAAMNNIIAKVKADNPQIKIFVSTQINYYAYTNVGIINDDMATVVENNTDCYLLDIYTYGRMVIQDDAYSHCTAVGYMTLAKYYYNYISYIMHMKYKDFKTVQFTGTNRSY